MGIDLVAVDRMERMHRRFGIRAAYRVLAEVEREEFAVAADGARFLAKRFAAKEAAAKALGSGIAHGVGFHDLWIEHEPGGAPRLRMGGAALERATRMGIARAHVSLSDERAHVVACVILETA